MRKTHFVLMLLTTAALFGCAAKTSGPSNAVAEIDRRQTLLMAMQQALDEKQPSQAREAATQLFAAEPEPWVRVLIASTWSAEGNRDEAFRELSAAIDAFMRDPSSAGPMAIDLPQNLAEDACWEALRSDPRYPTLLARAKAAQWHPEPLAFDLSASEDPLRTKRPTTDAEPLRTLRETYKLDTVIADATSDLDRVRRMCHWVNGRAGHDGWGRDVPDDALGLLQAAEKGAPWRCVEFGIAVTGCLNAVGIPARTVGGTARDVETLLVGAGHVFAEAWLEDRKCWVFVDAQMDLVAVDVDGAPLHSVGFRNLLARPNPSIAYPLGLSLCMYHFNFSPLEHDDKTVRATLAPISATNPTKFQRQPSKPSDVFTHRLADIYTAPANATPPRTKRVAIVLTNHGQLGDTGKPTGFYLSEATHPYEVFHAAGYQIDFLSPQGGVAPMDGVDRGDPINAAFLDDAALVARTRSTTAIAAADPARYDAIFFSGGHGTMWDFPNDPGVQNLIRSVYERGGVVAAVCHGPAALVNAKLSNGEWLVAGKEISSFTEEEETAVKLENVVPFPLETTLRARGARFVESPNFEPRVAVSERLVTGQNPASATGVAREVVRMVGSAGGS